MLALRVLLPSAGAAAEIERFLGNDAESASVRRPQPAEERGAAPGGYAKIRGGSKPQEGRMGSRPVEPPDGALGAPHEWRPDHGSTLT